MSTKAANFPHNPQKIALLTDSCADLTAAQRRHKPIFVLPLMVRCADGEYADGEDIFAPDIYRRLEAGEMPRTSLPDGGRVEAVLDEIAAAGYEKVIAIHLSGGLSGTYNQVRLHAAERKDLDVQVYDSRNGSLGIGMMLLQLWQDIRAGMDWETLTQRRVPALIRDTHAFFTVDTLEYLQKGGRIGKVTAVAGTLLNIKPLLGFAEDGQLTSVVKVRGRKAVQPKLEELLRAQVKDGRRYNLAVANGGAPAEMAELAKRLKAAFPDYLQLWDSQLDATLSTYIGAGVLGAAIQFLDDPELL